MGSEEQSWSNQSSEKPSYLITKQPNVFKQWIAARTTGNLLPEAANIEFLRCSSSKRGAIPLRRAQLARRPTGCAAALTRKVF
jgi:hypothetical protein